MDRRRNPRITVQLPVQVWGMDAFGRPFTDPAVVTNLSRGGMVLQGLHRRVRAGEMLDVRMGDEKAQFRVIWVNSGGDLGLRSLTTSAFVPESVLNHCSQAAAAC